MKKVLDKIMSIIESGSCEGQVLTDVVDTLNIIKETDLPYAREKVKECYKLVSHLIPTNDKEYENILKCKRDMLKLEAPYNFDAYLRFVEWNREQDKKFYPARRKALKPIVEALQDLADDKLDILTISLPPGIGKTATAIFYLTWLAGRNPEKSILGGSHSASFMRGVYDECLRIVDPDGEYLFTEVFPYAKVVSTNAQNMLIDLGSSKRFTTFEFTSIGAGNAGKVRASNLLYCDDLVDGIETALNPERLNKLYEQYRTDLTQRKIGKCKELHIATRWSVHDVIGRIQANNENNPRARFIQIPALDENDVSNFDYVGVDGFSTEFYHQQRELLDDLSWKALYMNEPIEREGLLYNNDELRRYFELPDQDPDAIISVCDTKDKGADYCVMPIAYQYGDNFYIEDVVCDNSLPELVESRLIEKLLKHNVKMCRFESNSAGGKIAEKVQEKVKERGGITHITTKYTTQNKETKILVNSPYIKEHFLFKDESKYDKKSDYGEMIRQLTSYTLIGKNKHDDTPDALAMLAEYVQTAYGNVVQLVKRPF